MVRKIFQTVWNCVVACQRGRKPTEETSHGQEREFTMPFRQPTLSPSQIHQMATQDEIELYQWEKERLTSDYLFVLAITNKLRLNDQDKDRLLPLQLAHLAITDKIDLRHEDKARLPTDLLFQLLRHSAIALDDGDRSRLTAEQLAYLEEAESISQSVCLN